MILLNKPRQIDLICNLISIDVKLRHREYLIETILKLLLLFVNDIQINNHSEYLPCHNTLCEKQTKGTLKKIKKKTRNNNNHTNEPSYNLTRNIDPSRNALFITNR